MARYLIPTSKGLFRIDPDKLVFVVADGSYSLFYHIDDLRIRSEIYEASTYREYDAGAKKVVMQIGQIEEGIRSFEKKDQHFIRIGNSLIINKDYIYALNLEEMEIELSDNETFHICRKAPLEALNKIKQLLEQDETMIRKGYK